MENLGEMMKYQTFELQLAWLMWSQLDENRLLSRNKIHADLEVTLKTHFPQGKIFSYGSSETGLAFKRSELHFFFDGTGSFSDNNKAQQQYEESEDSILLETLEKVPQFLYRKNQLFCNIFAVRGVNKPVITFEYGSTRIKCDISFKQQFEIFNNKLVKFCLTLDSRIKPLIIIIKCWAQQQNLYGEKMITNYPLVLLIFFYLQQPFHRLLPPMNYLMCSPQIIYKGFNVNFNENFSSLNFPTMDCSLKIPTILQGFFEFYSQFDFENKVICLSNGTAQEKNIIQVEKNSGIPYPELNKFACLQDPIALDQNVISSWNQSLVERFQLSCKDAVGKIDISERNSMLPMILLRTLFP